MTGFLVVNHFLIGKKYEDLHNHLVKSAKMMGIDLKIRTNQQVIFEKEKPDFVLFWDKDIHTARLLENKNIPVFNSARSIALCDDKAKTYLTLQDCVKQPKTIIAPLSFFKSDYRTFAELAVRQLGLPVVFKECFGSFGEQVFLCRSVDEVMTHITTKPFLLQEFIKESQGKDVRLEIVDGKCVAAMKRHNENDFRSNITNGGTAEPYIPTKEEEQIAVKACEKLGLTFGGVDMLSGNIVCEVNSNAHIINLMNCTGIDIAPIIFDCISKRDKSE